MGECARTLDVCLHDDVTACVSAYEPAIVLLKCAEMPPLVLPFGSTMAVSTFVAVTLEERPSPMSPRGAPLLEVINAKHDVEDGIGEFYAE